MDHIKLSAKKKFFIRPKAAGEQKKQPESAAGLPREEMPNKKAKFVRILTMILDRTIKIELSSDIVL